MTKNTTVLIALSLFVSCQLYAQKHTVYGYVLSNNGNPVSDVLCIETTDNIWINTDESGFFSIRLPEKNIKLKFSRVGYNTILHSFYLQNDTVVNISLSGSNPIEEVRVIAKQEEIHRQTMSGKIKISQEKIKYIPSFTGIPDIIKAVTYLPGVSGGKDGFSNIYVRGGSRDQNLVLMDNISIYNTNHFPGFVSVFNSNIIKELDLYKGGFPARYGGKLSSVLDIKTKNGNTEKLKGSFNIGILNSDFLLDFPLKNKKTTVIFAGRTTYYQLFNLKNRKIYNEAKTGSYLDFTFFDLNIKITHKITNKHKISFSAISGHDFYSSFDKLKTTNNENIGEFGYKQHNTGLSINHNFIINPKILFKQSLVFSSYNINNFSDDMAVEYGDSAITNTSVYNKIKDISYNFSFDLFYSGKHDLKLGGKVGFYKIQPGLYSQFKENTASGEQFTQINKTDINNTAHETAFFIEDGIKFSRNFNINAGLRFNLFYSDTLYYNIEPRISARLLITENFSVKASYTHTYQPLHILVNNMQGIGQEIWVASNKKIAPEKARQYSCGFFGKIPVINTEYGIEGFYKEMTDLIHYKYLETDAKLITDWDNTVTKNGRGTAYGIEFFAKKSEPKYEFSVSYTYAKSTRQFAGLNNGKPFPHIFDKTNDLSLLARFIIKKKYSFGANFVFNTGTPITFPVAYVKGDDFFNGYYAYSGINNMRLPNYHRLDVFIKKEWKTFKGRTKYFSINIFNVYAHQNPVYIYFDGNKVKQKAFYTILPTFNFGIIFS